MRRGCLGCLGLIAFVLLLPLVLQARCGHRVSQIASPDGAFTATVDVDECWDWTFTVNLQRVGAPDGVTLLAGYDRGWEPTVQWLSAATVRVSYAGDVSLINNTGISQWDGLHIDYSILDARPEIPTPSPSP